MSRRSSKLGKSINENNYDIQDIIPDCYNNEYHRNNNILNIKEKVKEELGKKKKWISSN